MKRTIIFLAVLGLAGTAIAQEMTFASIDADQDNELSFQELAVAVPDLSVDQFANADTDANGTLSEDEFNVFAEILTN